MLKYIAVLFFAMTTLASAAPNEKCSLQKTSYRGWSVYRLSNGIVNLYLAPQLGGRAIQLALGDYEYFFVNPDLAGKVLPEEENNPKSGWANYGGDKVWPAPEGWTSDEEWPGIPYYVLDGSTHQAEVVKDTPEEVALRMTSPPDPRTGIQFVRTFRLWRGTARVRVAQVLRNISRRKIRWGIWHVMQHNAADRNDPSKPNPSLYAYAPLNPNSMHPGGYYKMFGDARHPSYDTLQDGRLLRVHYLYRVGKVGVDASDGWHAVVNGQSEYCMAETFPYFPDRAYPDDAPLEFWNDGPGTFSRGPFDQVLPDDPKQTPYFFESEILSPYAELEPGEEYGFPVNWWLTRCRNAVLKVVWAGLITEPLSVSIDRGKAVLQGAFGVFHPGTAEAVFYNRTGQVLARVDLGPVDPNQHFALDQSLPLPKDAFRVTVGVRDADGESRGVLGNARLGKLSGK